jgi:hypothetical protein
MVLRAVTTAIRILAKVHVAAAILAMGITTVAVIVFVAVLTIAVMTVIATPMTFVEAAVLTRLAKSSLGTLNHMTET